MGSLNITVIMRLWGQVFLLLIVLPAFSMAEELDEPSLEQQLSKDLLAITMLSSEKAKEAKTGLEKAQLAVETGEDLVAKGVVQPIFFCRKVFSDSMIGYRGIISVQKLEER